MSNIRLDIDGIESCISKYKKKAGDLDTLIGEMDSILVELQGCFQGQTQDAFEEKYRTDFKPNLQRAQEMVSEISDTLNKTKEAMKNQDADIARVWR